MAAIASKALIVVVLGLVLPVASRALVDDATLESPPDDGFANVIVPHGTESGLSTPAALTPIDTESGVLALTGVCEVVEIPESARRGMLPKERQMDDRIVVGARSDGVLTRRKVGTWTATYTSKDGRFHFAGIDEFVEDEKHEAETPAATRPVLTLSYLERKELVQPRYRLAVKTVKPGERGIEPGMELRGGVKSIAAGTQPGTFDVYLEILLDGDEPRKALVRGTFDEKAIRSGRDPLSPSERSREPS